VYGDLDDTKIRMGERQRFDPIMSVLSVWRKLHAQAGNLLIILFAPTTLDIFTFWWKIWCLKVTLGFIQGFRVLKQGTTCF
jgi:hypothetical protein